MVAGGTVILAGGGDAEDSRAVDALLVERMGSIGALLYVPLAMDGVSRTYESCLAWLTATLLPFGRTEITMWTDLAGRGADDLSRFAAIYLGGGNTYRLLHALRLHNFDRALAEYLVGGGVLYGGSAGAIVLGGDIATCAHQDTNEVGLIGTRGLDLCLGYAVWCHYAPEDDPRIVEYVKDRHRPVIALTERAGAYIGGGALHPVGPESVTIYTQDGRHEL